MSVNISNDPLLDNKGIWHAAPIGTVLLQMFSMNTDVNSL